MVIYHNIRQDTRVFFTLRVSAMTLSLVVRRGCYVCIYCYQAAHSPSVTIIITTYAVFSTFETVYQLYQCFWNSSDLSDLGGRKAWGPHDRQTCLNDVFTFLTEVENAGRVVNTRTSSVNSEFVTAMNTWYFICFW
jgi:hypothetical protein